MKKYNGSTWVDTTLRQYKTATADIEPTIYTDGTAITSYTIKGNTVQNGKPTPSAPIAIQGVGEFDSGDYKIPISSGQQTTNIDLGSTQTVRQIKKLVLDGTENYGSSGGNTWLELGTSTLDFRGTADGAICSHVPLVLRSNFTTNTCAWGGGQIGDFLINIDNKNSEDLKSYIAQQYVNGTPVTVWYVLAAATTATVNEPLQKIGDYADTLSNAASISTIEGANSITVDTTVQPSEFSATWTGWHDAEVKEKSENLWGDTTDTNKYIDGQGNIVTPQNGDIFDQKGITVTPSSNYTFSWSNFVIGTDNNVPYIRICSYTTNGGTFINRTLIAPNVYPDKYATFTVPSNCTYVDIRIDNETSTRGQHFENFMLNTGSAALPYEPYWK